MECDDVIVLLFWSHPTTVCRSVLVLTCGCQIVYTNSGPWIHFHFSIGCSLLSLGRSSLVQYLTPLHASSVECASMTMDCRSCYIPTCTGSMCQIESSSSSPSQSTGVCTSKCWSSWQTAVSLSLISLVVRDCAQHTVAGWMYRAINEQHSAVGHSLSLDQLSGSH